ncbi:UNVERIFIED_CONTAM: hypothetical protein GTU68_010273 [Idotea baltica]|nr:hypothetical protein [Idotea baltica]
MRGVPAIEQCPARSEYRLIWPRRTITPHAPCHADPSGNGVRAIFTCSTTDQSGWCEGGNCRARSRPIGSGRWPDTGRTWNRKRPGWCMAAMRKPTAVRLPPVIYSVAPVDGGTISISEFEVSPEDAGLPVHPFEEIVGGEPAANAAKLSALLEGERGAYRDAATLNAAAGLLIAGRANDLREGVALATESIDSGAAKKALSDLVRLTNA